MERRKRNAIVLCLTIVVVVFVAVRTMLNSPIYLDWKIQQSKEEIENFAVENEVKLQELAAAICEEAKNYEGGLWRDQYRSEFPQVLDNQLTNMLQFSPVKFDIVYVVGQRQMIYQNGCCVFRHTITNRQGVYAWIDLVYAPAFDAPVRDWYGVSEEIMPDWYINVIYGY